MEECLPLIIKTNLDRYLIILKSWVLDLDRFKASKGGISPTSEARFFSELETTYNSLLKDLEGLKEEWDIFCASGERSTVLSDYLRETLPVLFEEEGFPGPNSPSISEWARLKEYTPQDARREFLKMKEERA